MDVPISGRCAPGYEAVRQAFADNFSERGEVGAALCVVVDGATVVDLAGGWADEARTQPWQHDTLVDVYSVGKAFVGLLVLQLVDEGQVGLDDPVASVWPEFAAHGKGGATIRQALCHQAGVPAIRQPLTDDDLWRWDRMAAALADTPPWFEPGSRHVYHTNTYGHLLGEIVRRATGTMPGERLAEVAAPLGADVHVGVADADLSRCAEVIWATPPRTGPPEMSGLDGDALMTALSYANPPGYSSLGVVNTTAWRQAQVPSTNTHASARGVARLYAGLVDPGRLLSPALLAEATRPQSSGWCPTLADDVTFGLGFVPTSARRPLGPNPRSFGHFGTGGALGYADPDRRLAFGYVMNHVIPRWQSSRNRALIDALTASWG